jgi:hypothetical protein
LQILHVPMLETNCQNFHLQKKQVTVLELWVAIFANGEKNSNDVKKIKSGKKKISDK